MENNDLSELENDRLSAIKDLEFSEFTLSAIDCTLSRLSDFLRVPPSKIYVESVIIRALYHLKGTVLDDIEDSKLTINYIDSLLNDESEDE